ncbi:MAG: hypothetical protein FH748_10670 [Balneolaceae bacterium]|nr:hypothetical protein [Balneolaceae bacterium]
MKKKISLFIGCLVFFFMGFSLTIIHNAEARIPHPDKCGTGLECYSMPGGCGEGVGCVRTSCPLHECPNGDSGGMDEYCYYCEDPE